ncbi:MAG: hypothetical protein QF535_03600 [Anaerolineales bacterium]|jgi:hypothetical protein|nr:hypothetical protein [Anaerolineales bacterium]|tara:strand:- start:99 stop:263 length:165 start_codon:yes stop_codon:yes gene_type:complete
MTLLFNELKEKIAGMFDVCLLCEVLEIEPEELLLKFEDKLMDNIHKFDGIEDED